MIVTEPRITAKKNILELSARVRSERFPFQSQRIWWRFPPEYDGFLSRDGNAFIPACLLPAMIRGERLVIEAPVSAQLIRTVPKIQSIYRGWYPQTREIEVIAPVRPTGLAEGRAVGSFFSGGVDSFHTFLKNRDEHPRDSDKAITHLIFSAGFDVKLKKKQLLARLESHLRQVSETTGTPLLSVSSNLKSFGDRHIYWLHYFGPFLAALGLVLEPFFRRIYIPSSLAWHQLEVVGSHPDLDILWSTERTQFVHDGCESTRLEKIVHWLAPSDLIPEHLHVCWKNRDVHYNCGVCEKCLRTMVPLYLGTGRTEFPCFSKPLIPENIRGIMPKEATIAFVHENLAGLADRRSPFDDRLREALQYVAEAFERRKPGNGAKVR